MNKPKLTKDEADIAATIKYCLITFNRIIRARARLESFKQIKAHDNTLIREKLLILESTADIMDAITYLSTRSKEVIETINRAALSVHNEGGSTPHR